MKLTTADLRWKCPASWLDFKTTDELPNEQRIAGQELARQSLTYGLTVSGDDQHIYVRGMPGVGRMALLSQMVNESGGFCDTPNDKCYIHNFSDPSTPLLLELPAGTALRIKALLDRFIKFIQEDLGPLLQSDLIATRKARLDRATKSALKHVGEPFEAELRKHNLVMFPMESGGVIRPSILPVIDGKVVSGQDFEALKASGQLSTADAEIIAENVEAFAERFGEVASEVQKIQEDHAEQLQALYKEEARRTTRIRLDAIAKLHENDALHTFLTGVENDLIDHRLGELEDHHFTRLYQINVIRSFEPKQPPSIIQEKNPSVRQLVGHIDQIRINNGNGLSDHTMIHPGSLLAADGGYLLLDCEDLLSEPGAWQVLARTLRTGCLDFSSQGSMQQASVNALTPETVPVNVKVILVGSFALHRVLEANDAHFSQLFKVLADFEDTMERTEVNAGSFANAIATISRLEGLSPLSRSGVVALLEHSVRIAADRGRFSLRFSRLLDLMREANWIAKRRESALIEQADITNAIKTGRTRSELPINRFRTLIRTHVIQISVEGNAIGQVNGLAISQSGPLTYGFPARITATVGAGSAGTISIDREANLSGSIHTKGFQILGGLMRHLLRVLHPLAFNASISFEQSYGGIDGDSASCAEIAALLSALTEVPIRQDLAITGAIDQKGNILPIGGATEKIEGFFAACSDLGLTGTQGVIIPKSNVGDLCLRTEVVEAARRGEFAIYAVSSVHEALALLTGMEVPVRDQNGYAEGSFLALAECKVTDYWELISKQPSGG